MVKFKKHCCFRLVHHKSIWLLPCEVEKFSARTAGEERAFEIPHICASACDKHCPQRRDLCEALYLGGCFRPLSLLVLPRAQAPNPCRSSGPATLSIAPFAASRSGMWRAATPMC